MQRVPVIANIYGYAVCLIAVVVFFIATAGFIGGVFNVIHPTPGRMFAMQHMRFGTAGRSATGMMWKGQSPANAMPRAMRTLPAPSHLVANSRYAALRRLVISLAMLILAGVLFVRHWRWLEATSVA